MRNTGKRASTSQEDESNRLSSFGVSPVKSVSPASATSRRVSAIIKIYKNTPQTHISSPFSHDRHSQTYSSCFNNTWYPKQRVNSKDRVSLPSVSVLIYTWPFVCSHKRVSTNAPGFLRVWPEWPIISKFVCFPSSTSSAGPHCLMLTP